MDFSWVPPLLKAVSGLHFRDSYFAMMHNSLGAHSLPTDADADGDRALS